MIALIHMDALKGKRPKMVGVEIIPCMLDQDGEPVESTPEQAETIFHRLKTYSEEFDTQIRVAGEKGYIDMA